MEKLKGGGGGRGEEIEKHYRGKEGGGREEKRYIVLDSTEGESENTCVTSRSSCG